jgi:hypothetical protein
VDIHTNVRLTPLRREDMALLKTPDFRTSSQGICVRRFGLEMKLTKDGMSAEDAET